MADSIQVDLAELGRLAKAAGADFGSLAATVRQFGQSAAIKHFVVDMKQARQLLKESGNNLDIVKTALKGVGVSGRDTNLILRQLGSEIDAARKKALTFESTWTKIFSPKTVAYAAHAMQTVSGGFSMLKSAMGGPLGMAGAVIGKGIDIGKGLLDSIVEAAEFRQNALTGMTYMLGGDANKARQLFDDAQKLAQATPLDTDKVIAGIKTFLTQGFTADESKFLYKVVADQASKFLDQPEMERNVVAAFSRLQGRGYATGEDLESLRIAGFRGADIMRQLQQQPGMKELFTGKRALTGKETETEFFKKVREVLGTGQVGKGTMLNAAIGSLYEGKELSSEAGPGALAKKFGAESLTGALSNAKNAFGDMLKSMDLVNTKGFKALMRVLGDYSAMLTAADGPGKKLRETIMGLVDSFLGGLSRIKPTDIERAISVVGSLAKEVMTFFEKAWGWLDKLVHAEPGAFLANIKDVLVDVGTYLGQGILKGVVSGGGKLVDAGLKETAQGIEGSIAGKGSFLGNAQEWLDRNQIPLLSRQTVGNTLDAESQATLAAGLSKRLGSEVPAFAEGGIVDRPTLALIGEGGEREYVIPESKMGGMRGGNGAQLIVQGPLFTVQGDVKDPDALGVAIRPLIAEEFANVWHRFAAESS